MFSRKIVGSSDGAGRARRRFAGELVRCRVRGANADTRRKVIRLDFDGGGQRLQTSHVYSAVKAGTARIDWRGTSPSSNALRVASIFG